MIRISTKGRYGSRFMLELAVNYDHGPMLLKEIAKMQELSEGLIGGYLDVMLLDVSPDGDSIYTKFPGCLGLIPTTLL